MGPGSVLESVNDLSVLVIAPVGRDARLIADALASAVISVRTMYDMKEVVRWVSSVNVGALLISEEALNRANIAELVEVLATQPAWSDLPLLILTVGGRTTPLSQQREQDRLPLGSVTLLERPIRIATLISSVRSALRSRGRQYQVRDTLMERDRAEQARLESETRLLLAIDTAHLGTWELNLDTRHLAASPTCRRHCDWAADAHLQYEDLIERIHPEDRASLQAKLQSASEPGGAFAADCRVIWQDGSSRWISLRGRYLSVTNALVRLSGVTLDITERVLSELALRNAEKLAIVGRLASSIAHEINNPLEAVTNLLYLLNLSPLEPAEKEYVLLAQQELDRVSQIAAQTLTFGRRQNDHDRVILTDILDSVLALYRGRLSTSNIQVERRYTYQQPVLCDAGEMRQVFTNLIANAFDATRLGGKIIVRERVGEHPVSGRRGTRITIADTGVGVPPEVKSRLFEAFVSTKGNNGTGLGLWISKGIVEKHEGTLRFRSSQRHKQSGSVFSLFIPTP